MKREPVYQEKFERIAAQTPFRELPDGEREFIRQQACRYRFTLQELKQVTEIALELNMWGEDGVSELFPEPRGTVTFAREYKKRMLDTIYRRWLELKTQPTRYPADFPKPAPGKLQILAEPREYLGLGRCPVASVRTRCCNLSTLDAVESCGFDCSYCSIQSFYQGERVVFDTEFRAKLASLEIDPKRIYHIGTGQSSDSLMWGNRYGLLESLADFARKHPNVLLELKTKSRNIAFLLRADIPRNMICTWSLNTPTLIEHEEHLTASLEERLDAARRVADRGILVGFHLHPMVYYDRWKEDYASVCREILVRFTPSEVAMISLGTLTFTKSVIKRIRSRDFKSKILRMPLTASDGKLSYPEEIKRKMFCHAYASLSDWHHEVFFYLCMENHSLWKPVFGYEYPTNEAFEQAMKSSYLAKMQLGSVIPNPNPSYAAGLDRRKSD